MDDIKLGRVGHYSYQEVCQQAEICHVNPPSYDTNSGEATITVNVHGHLQDGDCFSRRGVPVGVHEGPEQEFHLNKDCPWSR